MLLIQKLKALEKQIVFLRWATGEAYGKIQYVGADYIEFTVINNHHEYGETIIIRPQIILEAIIGGSNINKIVAEISHKINLEESNSI